MEGPINKDPRLYPSRPFAAIGVVVWRGNEMLIIKRAKLPREGQWGFIGGALEIGETHFEAARREAMEEMGIDIEPFAVITAIDSVTHDDTGKVQFHYSIVEVNARLIHGDPQPSDEILEARWVKVADLAELEVWGEMKRVAELAEKQLRLAAAESLG
jgi:ADP-ribose pyrophosphatase YjhB (NUDIX family)